MLRVGCILILSFFLVACERHETPEPPSNPLIEEASPRERIIAAAQRAIGQREATGHNDGAFVDEVLATVDMRGSKAPWCAAFNRWSYDKADLKDVGPRSAWSPDWLEKPTWRNGKGFEPKPGDVIGLYWDGRVRHTGIVEEWGEKFAVTIEGNTNGAGSHEGDGVYRKKRFIRQIYAVKSWLN